MRRCEYRRVAVRELPAQPKAYMPVLVGQEFGAQLGVHTLNVIRFQNSDLDVTNWKVLNVGEKVYRRVIVTLAINQKGFEALHARNNIICMATRDVRVSVSSRSTFLTEEKEEIIKV